MRRAFLVFAVTFLIVAAIYGRVPIAFLRAESGWFLSLSHSDQATQLPVVRGFLTHSYAGHYTPLAFLAELTVAKFAGTSRTFWRWRQLLAVAAVGAVLFGLVLVSGRRLALRRPQQFAIAAAVTTLILFQPAMVDFVTWPFMILQLGWLGLSLGALCCLGKILSAPSRPSWTWLAAGSAYASLHLSGLGLITVGATAAVFGWFALRGDRPMRVRAFWFCAVLILLGLLHAAVMARSLTASSAITESPSLAATLRYSLGFVFNFVASGLLSFTLISRDLPEAHSIEYCWPLGLLLLVLAIAGLAFQLRRSRREANLPLQFATMLVLFSTVGFAAMVALITGRQLATGPNAAAAMRYLLVTPRYIIPLQFVFIGPVILALSWLANRMPRFIVIVSWALIPTILLTQLVYQRKAMPFLTAGTRTSHYTCWRLLLAAAQECRAAGVPLPNFSVAPLTIEFSEADVEAFLPLLRNDLRLRPDEKIELAPLQSYVEGDSERYRLAPSVKKFEQKLEVARN